MELGRQSGWKRQFISIFAFCLYMTTAYLLLGTNMGDRECHLERARDLLSGDRGGREGVFPPPGRLVVEKRSHVYETAAWGKIEQDDYLNQVVSLSTTLSAQELLKFTSGIETIMGRVRKKVWEPRIIDLDILFYGDQIIREERLVIPHPHLQDRRFALTPLAEIAPDLVHPVFGITVRELLKQCPDPLGVRQYAVEN